MYRIKKIPLDFLIWFWLWYKRSFYFFILDNLTLNCASQSRNIPQKYFCFNKSSKLEKEFHLKVPLWILVRTLTVIKNLLCGLHTLFSHLVCKEVQLKAVWMNPWLMLSGLIEKYSRSNGARATSMPRPPQTHGSIRRRPLGLQLSSSGFHTASIFPVRIQHDRRYGATCNSPTRRLADSSSL